MPSRLMKSVSGIRGVVGQTFTPDLVAQVGAAFASFCSRGRVVVGRDTRPTGSAIEHGLISSLLLSGSDVVTLGVVPTPTVQVMVEVSGAAGGVVISASHNSIEWNAFKLINTTGSFLSPSEAEEFFSVMERRVTYPSWDRVGSLAIEDRALDVHIEKVLKVIDVEAIRSRRFKVAIDSVNGAGSIITPLLIERLGGIVIPVHCNPNGLFPRGAEPLPENLTDLADAVRREGADIGFAQDPDADRLAVVDETGRPIGEEYTIALVADHLLSLKRGRIVVNLSTTRAIDDIALKHGVPLARTRVGEIHVVEEMRRLGARIGGEGNGGVISPEIHYGRDSLAGIAYILEMMAKSGRRISECVASLPSYVMKKGIIPLPRDFNPSLLNEIAKRYEREKRSTIDGLRIEFIHDKDFAGGWVHLRPSNTEPVFRVIAEGNNAEQAERIYRHFASIIAT